MDQFVLLKQWMAGGGYVVASGDAKAWSPILGWDAASWTSIRPEHPYAGLAWQLPHRDAELIAPARWPVGLCRLAPAGARLIGSISAVQGERQTPGRALLVGLDAPAIVSSAQYCFLNGHPFAALQAWLQGQEDLQPWLGWRHRLFWLDEWVSAIADVLSAFPALLPTLPRPGIEGLDATTVILRHDLDHSRDTAYLEEEIRRGVPATHAVLRDGNTAFWRDALAAHPKHECALHYNTGGRDWIREGPSRLRGSGAPPLRPRLSAVARQGLLRQVRWAQANGIGVASLLRHLIFQAYPEWIDGLDRVFADEPAVLGASSMFRAQVLRWGAAGVDGVAGTVGEFPDSQFPLWLPFKLAHAGRGGARLRGWETTSLIESEPELVDQMLTHRSRHLPQRVITLGYHPAHAHGTTFCASGGIRLFSRVLDVIASHRVRIETARHVFTLAHAAEARANGAR
ncbi:MAG: hypothetical protein Q8O42_01850 [Acidobacteriota bacterium]|nr:hypothetical protein [Acidobacteriota bacterium]